MQLSVFWWKKILSCLSLTFQTYIAVQHAGQPQGKIFSKAAVVKMPSVMFSHRAYSSNAAQKVLRGRSLCHKLSMVCLDTSFSRLFPHTLRTVNFPLLFFGKWVLKDLKGMYPCSLKDVFGCNETVWTSDFKGEEVGGEGRERKSSQGPSSFFSKSLRLWLAVRGRHFLTSVYKLRELKNPHKLKTVTQLDMYPNFLGFEGNGRRQLSLLFFIATGINMDEEKKLGGRGEWGMGKKNWSYSCMHQGAHTISVSQELHCHGKHPSIRQRTYSIRRKKHKNLTKTDVWKSTEVNYFIFSVKELISPLYYFVWWDKTGPNHYTDLNRMRMLWGFF